jgi:hypothetical protein
MSEEPVSPWSRLCREVKDQHTLKYQFLAVGESKQLIKKENT